MDKVACELLVLFDKPFWIGVFEKIENGSLSVAKVTFGAEPKDYEVYNFISKHYYDLKFSQAVTTTVKETKKNPKRMQRDVKKQLQNKGIGTKSQQALKMQHEQLKKMHRKKSKERKEVEAKRQFELKQQKKKDKHRGK